MKFLTDIDLQQNILSNAAIDHASSAPSNPVMGQIYFDTTIKAIGVYNANNLEWVYGSTTLPWSSITNTPTTLNGYGITDAQSQITASGILKGDGAGGISAAVSGTDYQSPITGGASTIVSTNLTANRALISNESGKVAVSDVSSTELGYLDGVTSAIQTQLDGKVAANTAITGATHTKITYDSKGLVTAGSDLTASDIPDLSSTYIAVSQKGIANGVAELDSNGLVPSSQLPSYVDDVIDSYVRTGATALSSTWLSDTSISGSALTPESDKIYIIVGEPSGTNPSYLNKQYRWSGSTYVLCNPSDVNSVNGKTGIVTLDASDVGAQPTITASGILSGDGSGNITGLTDPLPIANGGTGVSSFTANRVVMSGNTTTSPLTTRAVTNNTSNTAITGSTNIPTMNTVYNGLSTINGASQTRATGIYAPTTVGTSGQMLVSSGSGAPTWSSSYVEGATLNGAAIQNPVWYAPIVAGAAEGQVVYWSSLTGQPMWSIAGSQDQILKADGNGTPTWSSNYVQAVTLNGTSTTSPSFYAPTSVGTSGYILQSSGNGAPTWQAFPGAIKTIVTNDSLTPTSGICEWTIDLDALEYTDYDVIISIYDNSTGEQVLTDVYINGSIAEVYIVSDSTIAADTYKAVIIG